MIAVKCAHCGIAFESSITLVYDLDRGGTEDGKYYCEAHDFLKQRDPRDVLRNALIEAATALEISSDQYVRWALPSLHDMLGFLMPGTVTYGAAFPANGKTAFISHNIATWIADGVRPWIIPTESRPRGLMTRIAARNVGVNADDAMSGRLRERMDAGDAVALSAWRSLREEYRRLADELVQHGPSFAVEPVARLSRNTFRQSLMAASQWGAGLVVVDHIDFVRGGDGLSGYASSEAIQQDAGEFAELYGLPLVLMTQLNTSRTQNDPLALYRRPHMNWLWMKGEKDQVATTVLGIFRPMQPNVDHKLMEGVKAGTVESWRLAIPQCMGIADLKSRYAGEKRDRVTYLEYQRGALTDMPAHRLREIEGEQCGIDTQRRW